MAPSSKASLSILLSAFLSSISLQSVQATPFKRSGQPGIDKRQFQVTVSPPGATDEPILVNYPDVSTFSLLSLGPDGLPSFTTTASADALTINEYPTIETPPVDTPPVNTPPSPSTTTTSETPSTTPVVVTTSSSVEEVTIPVGDSTTNYPVQTPCTTTSSEASVTPPVELPSTTTTTLIDTPIETSVETPSTPIETPVDTSVEIPISEPCTSPALEPTYPVYPPPVLSTQEPSTTTLTTSTTIRTTSTTILTTPTTIRTTSTTIRTASTTIRTTSTSTSTITFIPTDRPTFNPSVTATPIFISTTATDSIILISSPSVSTFSLISLSSGVPVLSSETMDCLSRPTVYVTVTVDSPPPAQITVSPSPETTPVASQPSVRLVTSWTTSTTTVCPTQPNPCP